MKKIKLDDVRLVLIASGFLSAEKSKDLSDEQFKELNFQKDLSLDSLDFIILLMHLDGEGDLSLINLDASDCKTVGDLINLQK